MPSSDPSLLASEQKIFDVAVELPPGERAAYLEEACEGRPDARAGVEYLLASLQDDAFMQRAADSTATPEVAAEMARLKPEACGDEIGNYKLREQIGEGGFGTVWVADQEMPVKRRVALKIIKLGMDTKQVIARFEQERQALALMDHPNIARVLDAGATQFGRPFFVMELVRGIKITDYCDQANLSTTARLELFAQVCHAVQHAHQKGIIHRDLKPSNILVTLHDGLPVPKVIDFGVAKATQQRLTDLTIYTQFEQMVGTPLYMSPEQAEMSGLDVDTRSDIYSLGVLLYELLVGRTPFDPETLMKAGLDEMRRVIREQEPQKPSTFVSTMAVDLRTTIARHRSAEEAKLIHIIRGDLDWIVMKALEKDRTRRYETASAFAQDIQRHLASEPVQARPASVSYRFRRFARRNKLIFAATSAVVAALITGLGISTWMFFQEKHARERAVAAEKAQGEERIKAESEASKSQQVAKFLKDMLEGVGPAVALGRDTKLLREILDKTAERVGKDLKDQPEVEVNLRDTLGEVYRALGDSTKAESMFRGALAIKEKELGHEHVAVANSLNNIAIVLCAQGKLGEAEAMHREALAMKRKLFGNENGEVAPSLDNLAIVLGDQGKLGEAEAMHREALAMRRKFYGNESRAVALSLSNLAENLEAQSKLAEAESMSREALAILRKPQDNDHPDWELGTYLDNLAGILQDQGKLVEAEPIFREALAMRRKLLGNEHPQVALSLNNLGAALCSQGKLAEAEVTHREALAMNRKLHGVEHAEIARSLSNLSAVLMNQGKLEEAEVMLREALAMQKKLLGGEDPAVAVSLNNLANVLGMLRRLPEAEAMHREALVMKRKLLGDEHPSVASSLANLAGVLREQGKHAEAEPMLREALAVRRKLLGSEHPDVAASLFALAANLREQGKLAEAETMIRETLVTRRKLFGSEHPAVAESLHQLAHVLEKAGNLPEAESLYREGLEMERKLLGTEDPGVASHTACLAMFLLTTKEFAKAEPVARQCLTIREKTLPDDWLTFNTRSLLGGSLLGQKKYAEAEPLLLSGYEGMKLRENKIPAVGGLRLKESVQRLVQLYKATKKFGQAADWQRKLDELDQVEAEKTIAQPPRPPKGK